MIRQAYTSDKGAVLKLGLCMWKESTVYEKYGWSWKKSGDMFDRYCDKPEKLMLVYEKGNEIVGMLLANTHGQFYTDIKVASQQLFYIHPLHRGGSTAVRLMKKFESFGRYNDCQLLNFSQSVQGVDDRWDKFCQNLGYTHIGNTYFKDL
tara:strand:- start:341 stop:790 length:450 start_codon:yes stop_codon:yes gene_type:complete